MDSLNRAAILKAAIAAPSADNSQPWKFHWRGDELELSIDKTRSGKVSDQGYLLSDLAAGACIENIRVQSAALGYQTHVTAFPEPESEPLLAARIAWEPSPPGERGLADAIFTRHTDRQFPWRPVHPAARHRLTRLGEAGDGASLIPVEGRKQSRHARSALFKAEALRFSSRRLHAELFASIRFGAGWREHGEAGLAPGSLAVERPLRPLFRGLSHWPVMRAFNAVGGARLMALRSVLAPVWGSPLLYILSVRSPQRRNILQAGRLLERFWLQAEADGISAQPFAAPGALTQGPLKLAGRFRTRQSAVSGHMAALTPGRYGLLFMRLGQPRTRAPLQSGRRQTPSFF